jgi:hypothetical protein
MAVARSMRGEEQVPVGYVALHFSLLFFFSFQWIRRFGVSLIILLWDKPAKPRIEPKTKGHREKLLTTKPYGRSA